MSIRVAILGASGYGGGELLRLLTQHPQAEVVSLTSGSQVGTAITDVHPHLVGFYDHKLTAELDWPQLLDAERACIFSSLPHGTGANTIATLVEQIENRNAKNVCVIDLSGDFRLQDPAAHQAWYADTPVHQALRSEFVYGLPELNRDAIRAARLIANPGCLATASILAAAPLAKLGGSLRLAIDAKTGSSGSGRELKQTTHHPTRHADFRAYSPLCHRHEPEIRQALQMAGLVEADTSFVPHSMDTARGVFASLHAFADSTLDSAAVYAAYDAAYAECPFIRQVNGSPTLQNVVGSNFAELSVVVRERELVAFVALDNLIKGMAGTAIQNMNLVCGQRETTGLWMPALRPV